jgi:AcrR family transcriptional regulator
MTDLKTSESTYQRILSAAAIEVTTFGSERATVVSIARSAAMTHANVYRHFESKTALFDAITQTWIKPIETKLHEIADAPDPARRAMVRHSPLEPVGTGRAFCPSPPWVQAPRPP